MQLGIDTRLEQILRDMASKIGSTVEQLWAAGTSYMFAKGVADITYGVIYLISSCLVFYLAKRTYHKAQEQDAKYEDNSGWNMLMVLLCIIAFIQFCMATSHIHQGIIEVLAPDGSLLMSILERAQGSSPAKCR